MTRAFLPVPTYSRLLSQTILAVHALALTVAILIVIKPEAAPVPELRSFGKVLLSIHQAQLQLERIQ
jgi:hypothetical protein